MGLETAASPDVSRDRAALLQKSASFENAAVVMTAIICAPKPTGYPLALIALRVGEVPPFSR
jgi:hypothetical protein